MGTTVAAIEATPETAIILPKQGELLGPDSPYERKRLALRKEFAQIIKAATELTVVDSVESMETATQYGRLLQTGVKEVTAFYKGVKEQIDAIKKPVLDSEKVDVGALETAKKHLGGLLQTFEQEERRKREAAEREARAEAERQALEEQLARAIELEASGELEQASAVLEEPLAPMPVVVQAAAPVHVAGKVSKTVYGAKVTDLMALVKAVAEGKAPIQALLADQSFLNRQATAFKEGFSFPGVELTKTESTHFRS